MSLLAKLIVRKNMPELPEVETIRKGLEKSILNKKIVQIEIAKKSPVKGNAEKFVSEIKGKKFVRIERLGKLLVFSLSAKKYLLVHLKMTGQLIYAAGKKVVAGGPPHQKFWCGGGHNLPVINPDTLPTAYTRAAFVFSDDSKLYFNDMRRFGYLRLAGEAEKNKVERAYGIEPFSKKFNLAEFKRILAGREKSLLKAALLDQALIAGIGNIYADEICFSAGVLPGRPAASLTEKEKAALFRAIKSVLRQALKYGGTTFRNYANARGQKGKFTEFLKVYGRQGMKCLRCKKGIIQKRKIAGRGTSFCGNCQK